MGSSEDFKRDHKFYILGGNNFKNNLEIKRNKERIEVRRSLRKLF
jgi:hypothetical protein